MVVIALKGGVIMPFTKASQRRVDGIYTKLSNVKIRLEKDEKNKSCQLM